MEPGMNVPQRRHDGLTEAELEDRFRTLTLLMYDTSVPIPVLEERVYPHLAPDILFTDPWVIVRGRRRFEIGLRGFHRIICFDFDIFQLAVELDGNGGGRVLVDGVMNLRQLVFYTYPLRTLLRYDFTLTEDGRAFHVTRLEEMWSFGDLIANTPLVGEVYDRVFRPVAGRFFLAIFWLSGVLLRPRPASWSALPSDRLRSGVSRPGGRNSVTR
jgi:hypothetical protein